MIDPARLTLHRTWFTWPSWVYYQYWLNREQEFRDREMEQVCADMERTIVEIENKTRRLLPVMWTVLP